MGDALRIILVVLHHKLLPQSPPDNRLRAQLRLLQERGLTQCIGRFGAIRRADVTGGVSTGFLLRKRLRILFLDISLGQFSAIERQKVGMRLSVMAIKRAPRFSASLATLTVSSA